MTDTEDQGSRDATIQRRVEAARRLVLVRFGELASLVNPEAYADGILSGSATLRILDAYADAIRDERAAEVERLRELVEAAQALVDLAERWNNTDWDNEDEYRRAEAECYRVLVDRLEELRGGASRHETAEAGLDGRRLERVTFALRYWSMFDETTARVAAEDAIAAYEDREHGVDTHAG